MYDKSLWRRIAGYAWHTDAEDRWMCDSGKALHQNSVGFRPVRRICAR